MQSEMPKRLFAVTASCVPMWNILSKKSQHLSVRKPLTTDYQNDCGYVRAARASSRYGSLCGPELWENVPLNNSTTGIFLLENVAVTTLSDVMEGGQQKTFARRFDCVKNALQRHLTGFGMSSEGNGISTWPAAIFKNGELALHCTLKRKWHLPHVGKHPLPETF